jgi:hypothetical protein
MIQLIVILLTVSNLIACNSKSKGSNDTKTPVVVKVADQRFKFLESLPILDERDLPDYKTKTITESPDSVVKETCQLDALGRHAKCSRSEGDPTKELTLKGETSYSFGANPWQLIEYQSVEIQNGERSTYTVNSEWGSSNFSKYIEVKITKKESDTTVETEENTVDEAAFTVSTTMMEEGLTKKYVTSYLDISSNVMFESGITPVEGSEIKYEKVLTFGADGQLNGWTTTTKNGEKSVRSETCTFTPSSGVYSYEAVVYKANGSIDYKYVASGKYFNYIGFGAPIYIFGPIELEGKKYNFLGSEYDTSPSETHTTTLDSLNREETKVVVTNHLFGDEKTAKTTTTKYSYDGSTRKILKIVESTTEGSSTTPSVSTTTYEY